jgi:hypothetical protein
MKLNLCPEVPVSNCGRTEDNGHSSDEDEDIPTMTPSTTAVMGSQGSLACLGGLPGDGSSRSLEGLNPSGYGDQVPLRRELETAGASEALIGRIEDMLMDHYYRVEASIFKVECSLKAQSQTSEEQQRYMHDLSERLSHVAAVQRSERSRLQDLAKEVAEAVLPQAALRANCTAKQVGLPQLDTSQQDRLLSDLRRDFDYQMACHEDRFALFHKTMQRAVSELAALRNQVSMCSGRDVSSEHDLSRPAPADASDCVSAAKFEKLVRSIGPSCEIGNSGTAPGLSSEQRCDDAPSRAHAIGGAVEELCKVSEHEPPQRRVGEDHGEGRGK